MKRLDGRPYKGTHTIFTMDYLCNAELTEQDLNLVFEYGNFTLSVIDLTLLPAAFAVDVGVANDVNTMAVHNTADSSFFTFFIAHSSFLFL